MDWNPLLAAARRARTHAYAPYSGYRVAAALLTGDGTVVTGVNVENGLLTLGVCAERQAVGSAIAAGHREFVALVVVTESSPPARPCGLCRQTLVEFVDDLPILCANEQGEQEETRLTELLPAAFRLADARPTPE
ncbi:MAG: cytidine deaminase [Acidobacteriota bacterium]